MAIITRTSTVATVTVPLACDPAVIAANPQPQVKPGEEPKAWALAIYEHTSDRFHPAAQLVVPEDACMVTFRPLSRKEIDRAEGEAGERSAADAAAYADILQETVRLTDQGLFGASDRVLAAQSKEKIAAYRRHEAWIAAKADRLFRAAVVSISDLPHLERGPTGFPTEALRAMDDPAPGSEIRWPIGLDSGRVIYEVAQHIAKASTLGKSAGSSSGSASGRATASTSAGSATAPAPATDTSPAEGPSPS